MSYLDHDAQYRWLQVDYQIGVFISRSSVNLFHVKQLWVFSVLQVRTIFYSFTYILQNTRNFQAVNVVIFTTEAIYYYIPNYYIVIALVLWEGLLGGGCYVNTFYAISNEVSKMPIVYCSIIYKKNIFTLGSREREAVFVGQHQFLGFHRHFACRGAFDSCPQRDMQNAETRAFNVLIFREQHSISIIV